MSLPLETPKLVKVFCESCIRRFAVDCIICGGTRHYLWDPLTSLCYMPSGAPMLAPDDTGETVNVVRRESSLVDIPSLPEMLAFIELWVSEDPRRKWKMWVDGDWSCSFTVDRFKGRNTEVRAPDATTCVERCYRTILGLPDPAEIPSPDRAQLRSLRKPGNHD